MTGFVDRWSGYLGLIFSGAVVTVELTVLGCALAVVMAFLAGLGRLSRRAPVRFLATAYIEFFRGTSILVQLFWAYFVPPLFGIPLTPLQAGVLALGFNVGASGAEVVRGAVRSVPREQHEACVALNLTRFQAMRDVILPQALVLMLPTFGNNAIGSRQVQLGRSLRDWMTRMGVTYGGETANPGSCKATYFCGGTLAVPPRLPRRQHL